MKALLAATVGAVGASWYQTHADAQAWGAPKVDAFSQKEFLPYKLVEVSQETHDVKRFRFALPRSDTPLNLPVASCITVRYTDSKGQEVARPYTPTNLSSDKGHFDLLVKCYPNSKMGNHLFELKVGDTIDAKGPWQTYEVHSDKFYRFGMIAGGTGITPMFQIINNILHQPGNKSQVSLLFANHTEDDILLGKELDGFGKKFAGRFAAHHCLSRAPKKWVGYQGHINKKIIQETMPGPDHKGDSVIFVSGPPSFMKDISGPKDYSSMPPKQGALGGILKELGYKEQFVYKF